MKLPRKLTNTQRRLVAILLLVFLIFTAANYYLGLGVLPRFAKLMMMLTVLAIVLFTLRFGPRAGEKKRRRVKEDKT